jgi:hypothetical protein
MPLSARYAWFAEVVAAIKNDVVLTPRLLPFSCVILMPVVVS